MDDMELERVTHGFEELTGALAKKDMVMEAWDYDVDSAVKNLSVCIMTGILWIQMSNNS